MFSYRACFLALVPLELEIRSLSSNAFVLRCLSLGSYVAAFCGVTCCQTYDSAIFVVTQKAWFWGDYLEEPPFEISGSRVVDYAEGYPIDPVRHRMHLRDHFGSPAAYLLLHDRALTNKFDQEESPWRQAFHEQVYEVVAISKGHYFNFEQPDPCNWDTRPLDHQVTRLQSDAYDFVSVLYVEFIDGIAYRRWLGRIFQEVSKC